MPWNVRKEGDKWLVVKKSGKVVGTHESEESAKNQQAALYANSPEYGKKKKKAKA